MNGKSLVNVAKCVVTNEKTGVSFDIGDTASEIDVEPITSQGKRDILRVKNKIHAINETEDIVIGYKLKLKDNTFSLNVMALVDGGTVSGDIYSSIPAGQAVEKDPFTLEVYTEEKDYSRTTGYTKFTFKHCKGKAPKYKVKDGDFIVPEFEAESIPFRGEKAVEISTGMPFLPGGTTPIIPNPPPSTTTDTLKVIGGPIIGTNPTVGVSITTNVKWTFTSAIDQDEVISSNFMVYKKLDNSLVLGNLTIDDTKKIVTFVPTSIQVSTDYTAEAKSVDLLDGTGTTTALSVDFTTSGVA